MHGLLHGSLTEGRSEAGLVSGCAVPFQASPASTSRENVLEIAVIAAMKKAGCNALQRAAAYAAMVVRHDRGGVLKQWLVVPAGDVTQGTGIVGHGGVDVGRAGRGVPRSDRRADPHRQDRGDGGQASCTGGLPLKSDRSAQVLAHKANKEGSTCADEADRGRLATAAWPRFRRRRDGRRCPPLARTRTRRPATGRRCTELWSTWQPVGLTNYHSKLQTRMEKFISHQNVLPSVLPVGLRSCLNWLHRERAAAPVGLLLVPSKICSAVRSASSACSKAKRRRATPSGVVAALNAFSAS